MDDVRSLDGNVRGILGFNFLSRFSYTIDYKMQTLRFGDAEPVEGTRVPFDSSGRSIILTSDRLRLMLDTGATGVFLFETQGLDVQIQARATRRVSTSAGVRVARSGILRRLVIGHEAFEALPVTLVQANRDNEVELSWPSWAVGFATESSTNLANHQWSSVTPAAALQNDQWTVSVPKTNVTKVFRLKR